MTILALRGWRSGLDGRGDRGRELLCEREREREGERVRLRLRLRLRRRLRLRLPRLPLAGAGPLLCEREGEREASRGVTERACDLDRASSGVGERPRDGLRLSDMGVRLIADEEERFRVIFFCFFRGRCQCLLRAMGSVWCRVVAIVASCCCSLFLDV